jgi:hypothetical protein
MLDNTVVSTETVNTEFVTDYRISVPGNGKRSSVKVYLSDKLYYEADVDYTKNPAEIKDERYYSVSFYVNVVGMPQSEALTILNNAGYTEIILKYQVSNETPGTVLYQSPGFSTAPHLGTDAVVVLTIAKTADETTEPPVDEPTGENLEG